MRVWAYGAGLTMMFLSAVAQALPPAYFVSTEGNDAWSGRFPAPNADATDGPFASPLRARDALRAHGAGAGLPDGGVVYIRGGTYVIDAPIALGPEDSAAKGETVHWRNFRTETVRLIGGRPIPAFTPHEEDIVKAVLPESHRPSAAPRQLFVNSARQTLARWPNLGEGKLPGGGWAFVASASADARRRSFHYQGDRPERWADTEGLEVNLWPNYNWWQTIAPVAALDTASKTITLHEDLPYTIEPGRRFFFQNRLEELDAPGEWYYDTQSNDLYLWPMEDLADAEVVLPKTDTAFRLSNARNINIMGFTIEAFRGDGITLQDSHACLIAKNVVRNTGGYGVRVTGGAHCRVMGNDLYHLGQGGIVLKSGNRKTLDRSNHQAINNHIHHFAQLDKTYHPGIQLGGVGQTAAHNRIHDAPHLGIHLSGNDHLLEYNEIHHVCQEAADNGGFYMGRDWTARGTIIRFNSFHNIYGFGLSGLGPNSDGVYQYESPHQAWGVYLDDCSSGTLVYGNVFERVPLCGVMLGGGRDNRVENNIFIECIPAFHIDDRWDAFPWDTMRERLEAMDYRNPPYSTAYPELLEMGDDPRRPEGNSFLRNIIQYRNDNFRGLSSTKADRRSAIVYSLDQFAPDATDIDMNVIHHFGQPVRIAWSEYGDPNSRELIEWDEWQTRGFDLDSTLEDPRFFNAEARDYRLSADSPAFELGFKKIPMHLIGLIADEFRASPPPPRDARTEGAERRTWEVRLEATP